MFQIFLFETIVPNGDVWYSCQARGIHTLQKVVKRMCLKAGLTGKHTNHSCRVATATRLYEQGCDEQLICEKTGHRSVAVRSYKRTSGEQMRNVSEMLYGTKSEKKPKIEPTSTVSVASSLEGIAISENNKLSSEGTSTKAQCVEVGKGLVLYINVNINK